jgi:hypothetical protein
MPMAGGPAERLTGRWDELGVSQDGVFYHPSALLFALMPDGARGLIQYPDPSRRGTSVAVVPLSGSGVPTRLDIPIPGIVVMPDGRQYLHLDVRDGVLVMVRRTFGGGPGPVIMTFPNESSLNFALSPDGKQLALSRGTTTSDVVLITQEK